MQISLWSPNFIYNECPIQELSFDILLDYIDKVFHTIFVFQKYSFVPWKWAVAVTQWALAVSSTISGMPVVGFHMQDSTGNILRYVKIGYPFDYPDPPGLLDYKRPPRDR